MIKKALYHLVLFLFSCFIALFIIDFNTKDVIVAVIDTGINSQIAENDNILQGYDFIDFDKFPIDQSGHGSLMTSIISEVSPQAKILPIRFLNGRDINYTNTCPLAIVYAVIKGADIINMSFNGDYDIFTKLAIEFGHAKGVIFVGSTGNKGLNDVEFPARYKGVIAVGGYTENNNSFYGSYGDDVDFIAPAVYKENGHYELGTSISSAYISGIISNYKIIFPDAKEDEVIKNLKLYSNLVKVNNRKYYLVSPDMFSNRHKL